MARLKKRDDGIYLQARRLDWETILECREGDTWRRVSVRPVPPVHDGSWNVGWDGVGAMEVGDVAPVAQNPEYWDLRWPEPDERVYVPGQGLLDKLV